MSRHYANLSIWVSKEETGDETENMTEFIESTIETAFTDAGYEASASVNTVARYPERGAS